MTANCFYTGAKFDLALPTCSHTGNKTDPEQSMPNVLCSASVGYHATSCPVAGWGGDGTERKPLEGTGIMSQNKQKQINK